jgi:hypothetical protein
MADLVDPIRLPDLTPVAPEAGRAEGHPRLVYACRFDSDRGAGAFRVDNVRSYSPSGGGASPGRRVLHWAIPMPGRMGQRDGCTPASP